MEAENWKPIVGYEDLYEVSTLGNVRRVFTYKTKNLKCGVDSKGYPRVKLCKNNVGTYFNIHRLVALAFLDNPENKPCVDHINRISTDNRLENLRWATHAENGMNKTINSNNTSTCSGVIWRKALNKWMARIQINRKDIVGGYFLTFEEAVAKRKELEDQYFGEFKTK